MRDRATVRRAACLSLGLGLASCSDGPGRPDVLDGGTDARVCNVLQPCDVGVDASQSGCSLEAPFSVLERPELTGARVFDAVATNQGLFAVLEVATTAGDARELVVAFVPSSGVPAVHPLAGPAPSFGGAAIARLPSGAPVVFHGEVVSGDVLASALGASGEPAAAVEALAGTGIETVVAASRGAAAIHLLARVDDALVSFDVDGTLGATGPNALSAVGAAVAPSVVVLDAPRLAYVDGSGVVRATPLAAPVPGLAWSTPPEAVAYEATAALDGGGLAYEFVTSTGRHGVRFRALDAEGTVTFAERLVSGTSGQGYAPSIAALAGGYLVLHRYVPDDGSASSLRLDARSTYGDAVSLETVASPADATGRHVVRVAPDGRVYLLFDGPSAVDGGTSRTVRATRLLCP